MSRPLRWTAYAGIALLVLAVAATVLGVYTVRQSFPQTSGAIDVPGLAHEVTVVRDDFGVPQIYADTPHDLFFAQGYVQAQDRFYEMDVRRHITAGRLSEMFGSQTLETDEAVRTMGWRRIAEEELSRLSPQAVAYLQAFSDGVNAYLKDRSPSQLSLEYTLLGLGGLDYRVEPWTPVDSLAWLKAMAWDLRGNMQDEIDRAMASTELSARQIAQLYPPYPYAQHRPIIEGGSVEHGKFSTKPATSRPAARPPLRIGPDAAQERQALLSVRRAIDAVPTLMGTGEMVGSNAWAVDGAHSTTGEPILANDPHLAPTLPGIWYQMGLHCRTLSAACPYDVSGFTFSGLPGVVIGHNQQVAWGFTNLGPDVSDLYLEAVRGDEYLRGHHWEPMQVRHETIDVAGGKPVELTVRSTVHGPLLSDVDHTFASVGANAPAPTGTPKAPDRGTGYAVSLAWTALRPSRTAQAIFEIDKATDWQQFRAAARDFAVPSQNLVYADKAGNIGYQAPGLIPIRKPANHGDWPSPGWDRSYDWTGRFIPFDQLPTELNPPDGFVVTANNAPVSPSYPYYLGDSWDYGYRSQRIADLIRQKGRLGVADMAAIQLDQRNAFAATLVPYLLRVDAGSAYYRSGQKLLRHWDFVESPGSAAAAYYNAVWRYVLLLTFRDDLPSSVEIKGGDRWETVVTGLLRKPHSPWWDDRNTHTVVETRDDILKEAMHDARDELVRLQARRPQSWTWGHQHTLTLENQTVGQSTTPFVAGLVNRGPWQLGGSSEDVDALGWNASEGYAVNWVPSMRMVVSLGNLDDSTWVNLTGASGHAFDSHYTDQTDLWARGETRSWPYTPAAVARVAQDTLKLEPDRTG